MGQVTWIRIAVYFDVACVARALSSLLPAGLPTQPNRETALGIIGPQSLPPLVAEYHGSIANSAKSAENLRS